MEKDNFGAREYARSNPAGRRTAVQKAVAAAGLLLCIAPASGQPQFLGPPTPNAPPLSGAVLSEAGARIQATVTAHKLTAPPASVSVETRPDGSFTLQGLPDGSYQLCAEAKNGIYLDPCAWSPTQAIVALRGAQPIRDFRFVLARGVNLEVRVSDAGKVLEAVDPVRNRPRADLTLATVTPRNIVQSMPLASKTGDVRSHRIAVSPGAKIFLAVLGNGVNMNDSQGRPIEPGRAVSFPITIPAGQGPPTVVSLTVTGARP